MTAYTGLLIEFARNSRGISQSELASRVAKLTQPILSKIEKGLVDVNEEQLELISSELGMPRSFFQLITPAMLNVDTLFRKRVSISQKENIKITTRLNLLSIALDRLLKNVKLPNYSILPLDMEFDYDTPTEVAMETRRMLGLGINPVMNIFTVLEKNGIVVYEVDNFPDKFDGVSFVTNEHNVVVVINKNMPNDRKRFTLAHELGHVVMHLSKPIPSWRRECLDDEANEFANEFLFPSSEAERYLENLSLGQLGAIKKYWLISKQAIIYRSKKYIKPEKVKYLMIELSRQGERKNEKDPVLIDKPVLIDQVLKYYKEKLNYSNSDLGEALLIGQNFYEELFEETKPFSVTRNEDRFEYDLTNVFN